MKVSSVIIAIGMATEALVSGAGAPHEPPESGYPHPFAPKWEAVDDPSLSRLFLKTTGDHLARVWWHTILISFAADAPLQEMKDGAWVVGVGRRLLPRLAEAPMVDYDLVRNDLEHFGPKDPKHWEKSEFFPVFRCFIVNLPLAGGAVAKFPDTAARIYGIPIIVTGKVSSEDFVAIVDRFWEEVVKQSLDPVKYWRGDYPYSAWLNRHGPPMWQNLAGVTLRKYKGHAVAILALQAGRWDDTGGFAFWLRKGPQGWEPTSEWDETMSHFGD